MRERWVRWLSVLGRLLPQQLRESVFEPACYDLVRDTLEHHRNAYLLAPRLIGILLHVSAINFPRVLIDHRRPSRLALLLCGGLLTTAGILVSLALVMRGSYGP